MNSRFGSSPKTSPTLVEPQAGLLSRFSAATRPDSDFGGYTYAAWHFWILGLLLLAGAFLRFWNLGDFSLRGDEEIMGLAVRGILEQGSPLMPSGLFYPRGLGQVYLMAASAKCFGLSEWALRFPSAVVGLSTIVIGFFLGKRFLSPIWNLAFVGFITFDPWLIEMSQTARMYIFFVASLMLYAIAVHVWDQTFNAKHFLFVFLGFLLSLHLYPLSLFFTFLVFYPFINSPSMKRFFWSSGAFVIALASFFTYNRWLNRYYSGNYGEEVVSEGTASLLHELLNLDLVILLAQFWWIDALFLLCIAGLVFIFYTDSKEKSTIIWLSYGLFLLTCFAAFTVNYHAAAVLGFVGILLYLHSGQNPVKLLLPTGLLAILFAAQLAGIFFSEYVTGINKLGKTMIGKPSIFTYLGISEEYPLGFAMFLLLNGYWAKRFAHRGDVRGLPMLILLSFWLPILSMGLFKQYFPPRFVLPLVPFFILGTYAGLSQVITDRLNAKGKNTVVISIALGVLVTGILVSPIKLNITTNEKYRRFPDHRGAALALKSQKITAEDIVIAEDVLQMAYYLDKVDFWLRAIDVAKKKVKVDGDRLLNIYTNVPLIGTGKELEQLLEKADRGAVYIIGSGETHGDYGFFLRNGIYETLKRYNPEIIYTGSDKRTTIMYFPPKHNKS